jgi:hypothetical protein
MSDPDAAYLGADAKDRRCALNMATVLAASCASDEAWARQGDDSRQVWLTLADHAYRWLRQRDSLKAVTLVLNPGTPYPEGTTPMGTTFDLSDTDEVVFTLGGVDAKGASVPAPADTWAWNLADPTGSVLTVSADTTTATVAAGSPDTTGTLTLTVTGQASGLTGAEAILVVASAATAIELVPGTPSAEAPAAPASDTPPAS